MSAGTNKVAQKAKPTDILSHWPKLIESFQFSSLDFYGKVEKALAARQIPDVEVTRVDWMEGGPLSARREYLRVKRERLVFDICGAPFGTGFFVSIWFGKKPWRIGIIWWCLLLVGILLAVLWATNPRHGLYWWLCYRLRLGHPVASFVLLAPVLVAVVAMIIRVGADLDSFLLRIPIVGPIYERFFRKITYYRIDLMCMYQQAVQAAVTQVIDEITKPQGIQPLSEFDRRPIMPDLFQRQG